MFIILCNNFIWFFWRRLWNRCSCTASNVCGEPVSVEKIVILPLCLLSKSDEIQCVPFAAFLSGGRSNEAKGTDQSSLILSSSRAAVSQAGTGGTGLFAVGLCYCVGYCVFEAFTGLCALGVFSANPAFFLHQRIGTMCTGLVWSGLLWVNG